MSDDTARLHLPQLVSLQELNAVTWNEALEQIDALVDLCLVGVFVNDPPLSPQEGDAYLTGGTPTGAWAGYAYKIASCRDGAWRFYQPFNGLRAFVRSSGAMIVYNNGAWIDTSSSISANEVALASADTCDLAGANALFVQITGTTAIRSFGTGANKLRYVRFAGVLTLTHNAASLVLLGGASRTTAAGDRGIYASDASGVWREVSYVRAAKDPGDYVTRSGSETLTGKTLSGATLSGTTSLPGGGILNSDGTAKLVTVSNVDLGALSSASTLLARNAAYLTNIAVGGTAVNDAANGATLGFVSSFSAGWSGQTFIGASRGFVSGTYDLYVRIRTDGTGSDPTSVNWGIYDLTSSRNLIDDTTLGGLTTSYQLAYLGRLTLSEAIVRDCSYLYFSRSGVTTNYFIDYIKFVPAPLWPNGRAGIGTASPVSGCALDVAGHIYPHAANTANLGSPSYYWANGYIQNAWTVISDERLKDEIASLSEAEMAVAKAIAPLVATYKMKSAIGGKGSLARRHCGWIAQRIEEIFDAHGLDPFAYGCVGFDPATKTIARTRIVTRPKQAGAEPVVDAAGHPVMESFEEYYEEQVPDCDDDGVPRTVHNLRVEEVTAFALAGLAARVAALEAALGDD